MARKFFQSLARGADLGPGRTDRLGLGRWFQRIGGRSWSACAVCCLAHAAAWAGGVEVRLDAQDACLGAGQSRLTVEVNLRSADQNVVGGQFFLEYDRAMLTFVNAEPGGDPFVAEIFEYVDDQAGLMIYGVGVIEGAGTAADSTLVRLRFDVAPGVCGDASLVRFDAGVLPTRLTNAQGVSIEPTLRDLGPVSRDDAPPAVVLPARVVVRADAGTCTALVALAPPNAVDACDATLTATAVRSEGVLLDSPYPTGVTTLTWTVADDCGNTATATQEVQVLPLSTVVAEVEVQGLKGAGPHTRCIEFLLTPAGGGTPVVVFQQIGFPVSGSAVVEFTVPCGAYSCIAARDTRHSLMRRDDDDFRVVGSEYRASFRRGGAAGAWDPRFDALPGGNFDGDGYVDVIDFCLFIEEFGVAVGFDPGCGGPTGTAHADESGDGLVGEEDFLSLSKNFLAAAERDCLGRLPSRRLTGLGPLWTNRSLTARAGPVTRLEVRDLEAFGLARFKRADVNRDLVIDYRDILAFAGGARP